MAGYSPVVVQACDAGVGVGASRRVCVGDADGEHVEEHESDRVGRRHLDGSLNAMGQRPLGERRARRPS